MQEQIEHIWAIKEAEGLMAAKNQDLSAVESTIEMLDKGLVVVTEKQNGKWIINQWVKKAILLYLGTTDAFAIKPYWFDKVVGKFDDWGVGDFIGRKIRAVPGCFVRKGAFIEDSVVIMPSFINIGSHIGQGTMIDSMVTVGSCVRIGRKCHISSSTVLAGVIEPVQASPVIIEDDCFIGAGCQIAEGVIIGSGSVIGAGVTITGATKIVDRSDGSIAYGTVKAGSVVVGGSIAGEYGISLGCAVIVKNVDAVTRSKTSLNELLRF